MTCEFEYEKWEAHWRLVNAAPDMLKALEHLLVRMELRETFDLGDHIAITGARAALAKAKGE